MRFALRRGAGTEHTAARETAMSATHDSAPIDLDALLGPGTRFEGTLAFEGRVRLEGELRGRIVGEDVLVVGPSAVIEAELEVGTPTPFPPTNAE